MTAHQYKKPTVTRIIRIGARSSRLSLWQANHVADLIRERYANVSTEIREYRTRGDIDRSSPLPSIGGKGIFTGALEAALRGREIDCAVHSLKDMPVADSAGLAIGAVPARGDPRDALASRKGETLAELRQGARIGTGSPRRRAQLLALRSDLEVLPIRGNVPTRIDKLLAAEGQYDALVLAAAGLQRLGLEAHISEVFEPARMLPAAGQGALALQCRADAEELAFYAPLSDMPTALAVSAERAFLSALEAGCSLPVGAYAFIEGGALHLHGRVISEDGSMSIEGRDAVELAGARDRGQAARELGARLGQSVLKKGAGQILQVDQPGATGDAEE